MTHSFSGYPGLYSTNYYTTSSTITTSTIIPTTTGGLTWTSPHNNYWVTPNNNYWVTPNNNYWVTPNWGSISDFGDKIMIKTKNLIGNFAWLVPDPGNMFNRSISNLRIDTKNVAVFFENDLSNLSLKLDEKTDIENSTISLIGFDSENSWIEFVSYKQAKEVNTYSAFLYDDNFNLADKSKFLSEVCSRHFPAINKKLEYSGINLKNENHIADFPNSPRTSGFLPILHMSSLLFSDYITEENKKLFEEKHGKDLATLLHSEVWLFDKACLPKISNCCIKEYSYLTLKDNITFNKLKKIYADCDPDIAGAISFLNQITQNSIIKITFVVIKLVEQLALDQSIINPEAAALNSLFELVSKNIV
jgi:hypothetical protein